MRKTFTSAYNNDSGAKSQNPSSVFSPLTNNYHQGAFSFQAIVVFCLFNPEFQKFRTYFLTFQLMSVTLKKYSTSTIPDFVKKWKNRHEAMQQLRQQPYRDNALRR
jgi:hypothetical protein